MVDPAPTRNPSAESGRVYSVVLSLRVRATTAQEAVAVVDREVRHLYTWPCRIEAATLLIDGRDDV